ncbi:hypothetical protein JW835_06405 [bacterium]|nr:hypothetical protein [bacterium]
MFSIIQKGQGMLLVVLILSGFVIRADGYQNFHTAIYTRVYEVKKMADPEWLEKSFNRISQSIKVDKIYLETHRDMVMIEEEDLVRIKQFFEDKGIQTSGGITITVNESNRFQTYCYTNPEHRRKLKEVVEFTARHFDEIILDDFFFTSCKCPSCIQAKGKRTWTEFRLQLLTEAARGLILQPARALNPDVTMIIKYPNWYEHFQGLGFNLETEPEMFDKLYTGTETRDPEYSHQHLQNYQSYLIFRYFENIKPGGNAGGWVDTGGMRYIDRYAEQIWLTLFAKAPEMTLFDYRQMMYPIRPELRADWHGSGTSFDFDAMIASVQNEDGTWPESTQMSLAAGYALDVADSMLGYLGHPIGVQSYKPFHSTGEDFIHNYLGMSGIPISLVPGFPRSADIVLLAETANHDPDLIQKIKQHLMNGKTVVITSGLLRVLQDKGLDDIVELRFTNRKALVNEFMIGRRMIVQSEKKIMIPQIQYLTNDSWEEITSLDGPIGWPILHSADYANGKLMVFTIPENFSDLYQMPPEVWKRIKQTLMADLYVRVDGPTQIALFVYDNHTFIVESFLPEISDIDIVIDPEFSRIRDLLSEETLTGEILTSRRVWGYKIGEDKVRISTQIKPHSFRVFRCE